MSSHLAFPLHSANEGNHQKWLRNLERTNPEDAANMASPDRMLMFWALVARVRCNYNPRDASENPKAVERTTDATPPDEDQPNHLLALPAEIRNWIFSLVLEPEVIIISRLSKRHDIVTLPHDSTPRDHLTNPPVLFLNKQIRHETSGIYWGQTRLFLQTEAHHLPKTCAFLISIAKDLGAKPFKELKIELKKMHWGDLEFFKPLADLMFKTKMRRVGNPSSEDRFKEDQDHDLTVKVMGNADQIQDTLVRAMKWSLKGRDDGWTEQQYEDKWISFLHSTRNSLPTRVVKMAKLRALKAEREIATKKAEEEMKEAERAKRQAEHAKKQAEEEQVAALLDSQAAAELFLQFNPVPAFDSEEAESWNDGFLERVRVEGEIFNFEMPSLGEWEGGSL